MTDHAWAYHQQPQPAAAVAVAADHASAHSALHAPDNGKVERYQQTLQREWAYALEYASSQARRDSLPQWGASLQPATLPQRAWQPAAHRSHSGGLRARQLASQVRLEHFSNTFETAPGEMQVVNRQSLHLSI
jgi:hypothetical protein